MPPWSKRHPQMSLTQTGIPDKFFQPEKKTKIEAGAKRGHTTMPPARSTTSIGITIVSISVAEHGLLPMLPSQTTSP